MSNTRCPNALKQLPSSPPFFHSAASWLLGGHETLKTWQEFKWPAHMHIVWSSPIVLKGN